MAAKETKSAKIKHAERRAKRGIQPGDKVVNRVTHKAGPKTLPQGYDLFSQLQKDREEAAKAIRSAPKVSLVKGDSSPKPSTPPAVKPVPKPTPTATIKVVFDRAAFTNQLGSRVVSEAKCNNWSDDDRHKSRDYIKSLVGGDATAPEGLSDAVLESIQRQFADCVLNTPGLPPKEWPVFSTDWYLSARDKAIAKKARLRKEQKDEARKKSQTPAPRAAPKVSTPAPKPVAKTSGPPKFSMGEFIARLNRYLAEHAENDNWSEADRTLATEYVESLIKGDAMVPEGLSDRVIDTIRFRFALCVVYTPGTLPGWSVFTADWYVSYRDKAMAIKNRKKAPAPKAAKPDSEPIAA